VTPVEPWRVVVAGGGVAGIETLLGLRTLGEGSLRLTLVTPDLRFVLRPHAVAEPFGGPPSPSLPYADIAREQGARFVRDRVQTVRAGDRVLELESSGELPYDALVLAVGAQARAFHPAVLTFDGPRAVPAVRDLVSDLTHARAQSVALVVPAGVTWALPMYELALMLRGRARRRHVLLVTSEPAPLAVFGDEPSRAVGEMLARAGIEIHVGADPTVGDDGHAIGLSADGPWLPVDRIVAPPLLDGPRLPGVPHDAAGFIPVEEHGRVPGLDRVYAAGDGTDIAIKQGGLAAQQADAVAEAIAARAGADILPEPFRPVLRGVLLTGRGKAWMRSASAGGGEGEAERRALFWPPTKIAGRYISPFLAELDEAEALGRAPQPSGQPVELDLERDMPAAADALRTTERVPASRGGGE
jgi:sulfide:quinone oxidoreductase